MNDWIYDHGKQHLEELHREAEQERLAHQLPHKAGLLETVLHRLATVIQTL